MIYFLTPGDQLWIIHNLIDRLDEDLRPSIKPISYQNFYQSQDIVEGTLVFTGLGVLTDVQREIAIEIIDQLTRSVLHFRVMNHPEKALGRFDLLKILHKKGLNSFQAYRLSEISPDKLHFPVFIREEHNHTGSISDLINNPESLEHAVKALEKRGFKKDSILVVEYLNTSDESGLYRKYSAQKIGNKIIPRYLSLDYHWVVKENSELPADRELYTSERVEEEIQYIKENPHERELREIFELAEIDFGRIDYGLMNGKIQTWEINTLPTFGGFPGTTKKNVKRIKREESKRIFYDLMSQAVRELVNLSSEKKISVSLSNQLRKKITKERRKRAWVNTTLWIGKKMPRIPFLQNIRAMIRRRVRQEKER
jgi:hypothetical protein